MSIDLSTAADAYASAAHDDEEPDERAKRLIVDRVKLVQEMERKLRKRIHLHGRNLPEQDREFLTTFLRRERDLTIAQIEDMADDLPEFSWPTDGEW